jgi:hypothetical protein
MRVSKPLMVILGAALLSGVPSEARAQEPVPLKTDATLPDYSTVTVTAPDQQPAPPQPTPRHTGVHALVKELVVDFKHLPSKENLYWAAAGGGLAAAVHPADDNVNQAFLDASSGVKNFFKPGAVLGRPDAHCHGDHRLPSAEPATSRASHTPVWT